MTANDHVVTIHVPPAGEISTSAMSPDKAHELFAWLNSYFEGVEVTLEQVVPVVVKTERRGLWRQPAAGGPTQHLADAIRQGTPDVATAPQEDDHAE